MKIKWKLFFSTLLVVTLGFCMGGSLFLARNFQHILDSRLEQAGLEHYTTQYVFELQLNGTLAITENHRSDILIKAAAWAAENLSWQEQTFCVSHEDGTILYSNFPARIGEQDILDTFENAPQGKLVSDGEHYDLLVTTVCDWSGVRFLLTTSREVTDLFLELRWQAGNMLLISAGMILLLGVVLLVVSGTLTGRIEKLDHAAHQLAGGDYSRRVQISGQDEIARLGESFNQMAGAVEENIHRLESYAKSRDEFAANFSHELKTPMTSIIGYADLLRSRRCDEETTIQAAQYIFEEGKRLEQLAQKLLSLMKLRQTRIELSSNDLGPVLPQAAASVRPLCESKSVQLRLPDCGAQAVFDLALLQTLLVNLLRNAAAACDKNGLIQILLEEKEDRWVISVRDNGCGIPTEDIPRLTEEFYRVDRSRTRAGGGTGLGLAICREIAKLHGSELCITSTLGTGTTVSFELGKEGVTG